jgi:hypothetical protein
MPMGPMPYEGEEDDRYKMLSTLGRELTPEEQQFMDEYEAKKGQGGAIGGPQMGALHMGQ